MTIPQIIAIAVFVAVMFFVITEKLPRAIVALVGAAVLVITGVVSPSEAAESIDFNTIGVLMGMMMYVAVVKTSGLFEFIAIKAAKLARGNPIAIMALLVVITAMFSAMLDNVTTILLILPMTLMICRTLEINPVPFFICEAMASNIGGTSTLIGDPPNIIIGSQAGLSFMDFICTNGPVVAIILVVLILIWRLQLKKRIKVDESRVADLMQMNEKEQIARPWLFYVSICMIVLVSVMFGLHSMLGVSSAAIALSAAAIMIVLDIKNIRSVLKDVEWNTLLFFLGLFVVVGGLDHTGLLSAFAGLVIDITGGNMVVTMIVILWISAIASAFVDNVPFAATMIPVILAMEGTGIDVTALWWALSLGACLGGNATIIGASANVVMSEISNTNGHPISFGMYFKECFPLTMLTVAISMVYLLILF